jgi:hypothetical protein
MEEPRNKETDFSRTLIETKFTIAI